MPTFSSTGILSQFVVNSYLREDAARYWAYTELFTQLSKQIFTSICTSEVSQLRSYEKINKKVYQIISQFFTNHLELLFTKFDMPLIEKMLRIL